MQNEPQHYVQYSHGILVAQDDFGKNVQPDPLPAFEAPVEDQPNPLMQQSNHLGGEGGPLSQSGESDPLTSGAGQGGPVEEDPGTDPAPATDGGENTGEEAPADPAAGDSTEAPADPAAP